MDKTVSFHTIMQGYWHDMGACFVVIRVVNNNSKIEYKKIIFDQEFDVWCYRNSDYSIDLAIKGKNLLKFARMDTRTVCSLV